MSSGKIFLITGEIKLSAVEVENNYNEDFNRPSDRFFEESKKFDFVQDNAEDIKTEIKETLRKRIKPLLGVEQIRIDIFFERGSILVSGMIIIDFLGKISGAISFFDYIAQLIKSVSEGVIKKYVNRGHKDLYSVEINVAQKEYIETAKADVESSIVEGQKTFFDISPSKLLLAITTINIIFFVGGTLFNLFQVDSLQKRYNEANDKYLEATKQYNEASKILNSSKADYQNKLSEIDAIEHKIIGNKEDIIKAMASDTIGLISEINQLNLTIQGSKSKINTAEIVVKENDKFLETLRSNIYKLREKEVKFGLFDIWKFMKLDLQVIITIIPLLIIIALFRKSRKILRGSK